MSRVRKEIAKKKGSAVGRRTQRKTITIKDFIMNSSESKNKFDDTILFLNFLDPKVTSFCFQTFDDRKIPPGSKMKKRKELTKILNGNFDELADRLLELNNKGAGIYVTINETDGKGRKDKNITRVRAGLVDLDGAPLEPVLNAEISPHLIVETSPRRYQVFYSVTDCPLDQFTPVQKSLAAKFNGDTSVIDLPRVVRLPGFYHMKDPDNPFLSRIHKDQQGDPYILKEFISKMGLDCGAVGALGALGALTRYRGPNHFVWDGKSSIPEGERNSTLYKTGCYYRGQMGYDDDQISEALRDLNRKCDPPLPDDEVDKVVAQVCKHPIGTAHNRYSSYRETPSGLIYMKPTNNGDVPVPLANFNAKIISEIAKDDGSSEIKRNFEISARLKGDFFKINVPANDFNAMGWPVREMGAEAIVYPGTTVKDHVRVGIQTLSGDEIPKHTIYTHLGWRKIDKDWAFLHSGGAIDAKGMRTDVTVEPDGARLKEYELLIPPTGAQRQEAIMGGLSLIDVAPQETTYPLTSAIFRAPLGEAMDIDLTLFLAGGTGCQKSEITGIAQSFFGHKFHGKNLPGNWNTTANSLERQSFLAKDCIFTIDDFAPTGTQSDVARIHRDADRLLRAQGNRSGRGRMRQDGSLRPENYPRCLIISSGEDIPKGQSLRARILVIQMKKGDVRLDKLTDAQRIAGEGGYASCMSAYLQYIAQNMNSLKKSLPVRFRELREQARHSKYSHDRTPDIIASLMLGMETFIDFAVKNKAISQDDGERVKLDCWKALTSVGGQQSEHQAGEESANRFMELLFSAISSGYAYVAGTDGKEPKYPGKWGWTSRGMDWVPNGRKIGWIDSNDELYLDPQSTYAVIQRLAGEQNSSMPTSCQTLWKRLDEKGMIASKDEGRNTVRRHFEGQRRNVIHLKYEKVENPPKPPEHDF